MRTKRNTDQKTQDRVSGCGAGPCGSKSCRRALWCRLLGILSRVSAPTPPWTSAPPLALLAPAPTPAPSSPMLPLWLRLLSQSRDGWSKGGSEAGSEAGCDEWHCNGGRPARSSLFVRFRELIRIELQTLQSVPPPTASKIGSHLHCHNKNPLQEITGSMERLERELLSTYGCSPRAAV